MKKVLVLGLIGILITSLAYGANVDVTFKEVPKEAVDSVRAYMKRAMQLWIDKQLEPPANKDAVELQKENWLDANGPWPKPDDEM